MAKTTMKDYTEGDYNVGDARWRSINSDEEIGTIYTKRGIVISYTCYFHVWQTTRLEFAIGGRTYSRWWDRVWGKRTIVRLAKQFAEDMWREHGPKCNCYHVEDDPTLDAQGGEAAETWPDRVEWAPPALEMK